MSRPGNEPGTKAMTMIRTMQRRVEDDGQDDEKEEQGDREQDVDDAHHEGVDPAAEEAGHGAVERTPRRRQDGGREARR